MQLSITLSDLALALGASWAYYMPLDSLGRAQGAMACLTAGGYNYKKEGGGLKFSNNSMIVGSYAGSVDPAGFKTGMNRGHLLGRQLGGAGNDRRNLVPLWPVPNQQVMQPFENQIAGLVQTGTTVFYSAIPTYNGTSLIPSAVTINAYAITPTGPSPILGVSILNNP